MLYLTAYFYTHIYFLCIKIKSINYFKTTVNHSVNETKLNQVQARSKEDKKYSAY